MRIPKLAKIENVASRDASRLNLMNPYLDVAKKRIMATDGHAMAIVPVEVDPDDHSGPITAEALKAARKATGRSVDVASLMVNGAQVVPMGATFPRPVDCSFPPVDQVIPDHGSDAIRVSFNPWLFLRAVEAMGVDSEMPVILSFQAKPDDGGERLTPIKVTTDNGGAFAVVMPCRIGGGDTKRKRR